ncbi:hypothetical protein QAD02_023571 [Eretmocerus hayati]|uniref:Uncharacterized protein n=1 Tax=Eretmocerus hayati TaxID=131215 RepID=A0ACC2PZL2_9HYME|nr:hypothetical protein QAD02_023571 [Eretmocerus hayati]
MDQNMKIGIGGVSLFVFGVAFGWVIFPQILDSQIHTFIALKPGSPTRDLWSKFPFFIEYKIYLFNVTNADDVSNGAKPILQEVGPYFFEEWHEKTDLFDRLDDDTLEYSVKRKWIFRPDLSEGLTGKEEVILPHVFILATVMSTLREKPHLMPLVNTAINSIFRNPESLFMKVKAMDMIFDGIPIDCTVTDLTGSIACTMIKKEADSLMKDGDNRYKFSLLGVHNNTPTKARTRVLRGVKNMMDVGLVTEYQGKKTIDKWNDPYCDTINGTDGTIFHPFRDESEDVIFFTGEICRTMTATFMEKSHAAGMQTNRYTIMIDDTVPSQKCYCPSNINCPKKGIMDLYECVGAPVIVSHAHFYTADEDYINMVDGMEPSKEKHETFLDFDPVSGAPLSARSRFQLNMPIKSVEKIPIMANLPDVLLPIVWMEEGLEVPDFLVDEVKKMHTFITFAGCLKWLMVLAGLIMSVVAGYMYNQSSQKLSNFEITKFSNSKSGNEKKIPPINIHTIQSAQVSPNLV